MSTKVLRRSDGVKRIRDIKWDSPFRAECPKCHVDTFLYVQAEGKYRMLVFCPDCNRGSEYMRRKRSPDRSHRRKVPDELMPEIKRLYYEEGLGADAIIERLKLNVAQGAIYRAMDRHKLPRRPPAKVIASRENALRAHAAWLAKSSARKRKALAMIAEGYSNKEIHEATGYCYSSIWRLCRQGRTGSGHRSNKEQSLA